jgi:NADH-quinone oxidoreductase subunit E
MSVLSDEIRQKILDHFPRYPNKQAVTLPALHLVHDAYRCVSREAVREIAALLDLSPAEVYDTMSFYQFFREEKNPLGQTRLWVCRSLACDLRGADDLLRTLCQKLQTQPGSTTSDGKVSLESAECIGACEMAPCVLVNDEARPLPPEQVDALVEELRQ